MNVIIRRINIFKEIYKFWEPTHITQNVSFSSKISSLFQLYGLRKLGLRASVHVNESKDGCVKIVTIKGRSIYWPLNAPVSRLVDMYFEVFYNNNHRFDTCGTPVLSNDVVIDAGCCEGYFAKLALENGASKVYCFEPGKVIGDCLKQTFAQDILDNRIEIVQMLLGASECRFNFLEDPQDPTIGRLLIDSINTDSSGFYPVNMTSLDSFCVLNSLNKIDYIKIDVEGSEPDVIEGAKNVIKSYSPRIAVAVYHAPHHAKYIQDLIYSINNEYKFELKGLVDFGGVVRPVMLHCYIPVRL